MLTVVDLMNRGDQATVLSVPFELRGLAQAAGAEYTPGVGHVLRGPVPATLHPFVSPPFSWERWRQAQLNGVDADRFADYLAGGGPADTVRFVPRPHQLAGAKAALAARDGGLPGFVLADETGLGKTITALLALRAMSDTATVLVVCPLSVVEHWRRTVVALGPGGRRVVVVNYDRLKSLLKAPASARSAKRVKTRNARTAKSGRPLISPDAVVFDESHRLRNPATQTSAAARRIAAPARFTLWASATAGQNPLELSYLARLLTASTGERIGEVDELDEWAAWCDRHQLGVRRGEYGRWVYERSPGVEERLRRMLFDPGRRGVAAAVRRRPTDIAGWPSLTLDVLPVTLSPEQRVLYATAWTQFRRELRLASPGRESQSRLVAQLRFRQKCSLLRVPQTVDLAEDYLASGYQVVLSVAFHETASELVAKLGGPTKVALITGATTGAAREAERVRFQTGQVPVVITTVVEGISLHAGEQNLPGGRVASTARRVTLAADPRWTALELTQLAGRAHRDGQFSQLRLLVGAGTVEADVTQAALDRWKSLRGMQGDPDADLATAQLMLDRAAAADPLPLDGAAAAG